jgi:hypothetical protein
VFAIWLLSQPHRRPGRFLKYGAFPPPDKPWALLIAPKGPADAGWCLVEEPFSAERFRVC